MLAASVLRKAAELFPAAPADSLPQAWQRSFSGARAALAPPASDSAAVASFGVRVLSGRVGLVCQVDSTALARLRTLAATAVDLRSLGRHGDALALCSLALSMAGDVWLASLLPFLICLEAMNHCGLARQAGGWGTRAAEVFWQLAVDEAVAPAAPRLVLCCGLSGSGKSLIATGIAVALGARTYNSDRIRRQLLGADTAGRISRLQDEDPYSPAVSDRVYEAMLSLARAELERGFPAVLDATFLSRARREPPLRLASEFDVPAAIVLCTLDDVTARLRLLSRGGRAWNVSEADETIRWAQAQSFEIPQADEDGASVLLVDTTDAPGTTIQAAVTWLRSLQAG